MRNRLDKFFSNFLVVVNTSESSDHWETQTNTLPLENNFTESESYFIHNYVRVCKELASSKVKKDRKKKLKIRLDC